jgi:hypothetical protein
MRHSIVEIDSTDVGPIETTCVANVGYHLEAIFVHEHLSKGRTYLLAAIDNWGHSYVRIGDCICLQKDLDDLVLVYALLQLSVAFFSEFCLSDILFSGYVLKFSPVPWSIICYILYDFAPTYLHGIPIILLTQ